MPFSFARFARRAIAAFPSLLLALIFAPASILPVLGETGPSELHFDIPEGPAEGALKRFTEQAGVQVLFSPDHVRAVRTNAVMGEFAPFAALRQMVAGTNLVAFQDAESGALGIKRGASSKPSEGTGKVEKTKDRSSAGQDDLLQLDSFEVVGTKDTGVVNQGVIPRAENQALRYEVFSRDEIERSGATSLSELFYRQIPSITSAGTGTQRTFAFAPSFSTGFGTTTDAVNFRGLGTNRTLTLVNGRRLYAGEAAGADVSRFPIAAIDRLEILPSSASAIYGGNAVGGIVNVILRKSYQGGEGRFYVGGSTKGGGQELQASYFQGMLANDGKTRISASVDSVHKESLMAGERGFYWRALKAIPPSNSGYLTEIAQNFVGSKATLISTSLANLQIPGASGATYASVPSGSIGTGLVPGSFSETAGQATVSDQRLKRGILLPRSDTNSAFVVLERELNSSGLEGYLELGFRYSGYEGSYPGYMPTVTLAATNALNPFRTGVTSGFTGKAVRVAFDPSDLPDAHTNSLQRSLRGVGGLKGKFAVNDWHWSADFSWDRTESRATTTDYLRFLAAAVNAGVYNPLRDFSQVGAMAAEEREKYSSTRLSLATPVLTAVNLRANGNVFELPAGSLAISVGGEARYETDFSSNEYSYGAYSRLTGASVTASSSSDTSRRILAGYLEATLPVVGKKNRLPGVSRLEFSAAGRAEAFDDFGNAISPMFAVLYEPLQGLGFRSTYSEGFLPPSQSSLYTAVATSTAATASFVDPRRPGLSTGPLTQTTGGSADLRPEKTKTWDLGVIAHPKWLPNFSLSVSYYRYDTTDRIVTPSLQNIVDWESLFPSRVTRATPTSAEAAAGLPGLITGVDRTSLNVARLITDGIDFKASYRIPTEQIGAFTLSVNGTKGLSYRTQSAAGASYADSIGDIGDGRSTYPPLKLRGQLGVGWEKSVYSASWTGRYTGEYETSSTYPTEASPSKTGYDGDSINPSFEMDLQFSYRIPYRSFSTSRVERWLGGTQWTVGCLNVLDREPPYITTYLGWYSLFSDPRGRFAYMQVKKAF